jgi:alkylation response protein AidB-like acyl-CoA dehydrogenase
MRLEAVVVPASYRLCGDGEGFPAMLGVVLPWFLLGTAAISVSIARAATEATRQHLAGARLEHLGQALSSLLNLRARLAQMQILVDTHQVFVDHAAGLMAKQDPGALPVLLEAKAAAAEAALQATDLAMRTCGGAAFGRLLGIERHFRDARASSVMAPTTDVLHDLIAKKLLDLPLF